MRCAGDWGAGHGHLAARSTPAVHSCQALSPVCAAGSRLRVGSCVCCTSRRGMGSGVCIWGLVEKLRRLTHISAVYPGCVGTRLAPSPAVVTGGRCSGNCSFGGGAPCGAQRMGVISSRTDHSQSMPLKQVTQSGSHSALPPLAALCAACLCAAGAAWALPVAMPLAALAASASVQATCRKAT